MATPKLLERYRKEVTPAMVKEFSYKNVMRVPRLEKVVLNIGMGEALQNAKALDCRGGRHDDDCRPEAGHHQGEEIHRDLQAARGQPIGVTVTLRGERMWSFLDRLMNIALPRQRDFRGVSPDSFDGRGNYSLGLREQLVWPEISTTRSTRSAAWR